MGPSQILWHAAESRLFTGTQIVAHACKAAAAKTLAMGQGLCPQCKYGARFACCRTPSFHCGEVMISILCALGGTAALREDSVASQDCYG